MKFRTVKQAQQWARNQMSCTGLVHRVIMTKAYKQWPDGRNTMYWCFTVVLDTLHFTNRKTYSFVE